LRRARRDADLTQAQAAKALETWQQTIARWERDGVHDIRTLGRMAEVYGVDLRELVPHQQSTTCNQCGRQLASTTTG